jgi:hypothetical protein
MPHRILVLLLYYNRPTLVRHSLRSVIAAGQNYPHWEMTFIDDGSPVPGEPIVRELLSPDELEHVRFLRSDESLATKLARGGISGRWVTDAMHDSDADLCLFLCDDDRLHPNYFANLSAWFERNRDRNYCYSHLIGFDPVLELPEEGEHRRHHLNHVVDLFPANRVDASQVCWRLDRIRREKLSLPDNCGKALDKPTFQLLSRLYGRCPFSGFVSQYKSDNFGGLMSTSLIDVWKGDASPDIDEHIRRLTLDRCRKVVTSHLETDHRHIAERVVHRFEQNFPEHLDWHKALAQLLEEHRTASSK